MEGRGRGRDSGFPQERAGGGEGRRGGGGGSVLLPGLEGLLTPYLPFLPAEPDQQPDPDAVQEEPATGQEQQQESDVQPGESSAPEGEQDGEIALVDGIEPGGETAPEAEAESEGTAEVVAEDSEPGLSQPDQEAELEVDQLEPESGQDLDTSQELEPVEGSAPEVEQDGASSRTSSVMVSSRSRAKVRVTGQDRLFGTGRDDRIRGSRRAEFIVGRRGEDKLTGGDGPDRFGFRWGDSRIWAPDRITDFSFGEDKISLFGRRSRRYGQPFRLSRAADNSTATSLQQLAVEAFADADGRRAGNQPLRRRSAVLVQATNPRIRGTYLLINNNNPDLNLRRDLMVKITGFSGELPDFGRIDAATVFG